MITSATLYLHPQSGSDWLSLHGLALRALPTSIISCPSTRGHSSGALSAAFLCACVAPAAVYAHFLFNSARPVKQSLRNFANLRPTRLSVNRSANLLLT